LLRVAVEQNGRHLLGVGGGSTARWYMAAWMMPSASCQEELESIGR
jgi:hypothetical protein